MSRLTLLHINIIGVVVAIIVAVGMYFVLISPAMQEIEQAKTKRDGVLAEAAKLDASKRERDDAIKAKKLAEVTYQGYERQYMPVIGLNKATRMQLMMQTFWPNGGKSWPERFIRTFRRHMSQEQKINKVVWLNPAVLQLGPYGPDPNTINAGMAEGDGLGDKGALHYAFQMQVRAPSLAALMRHVRDWNSVSGMGMPVVSNLAVTGNSPRLQATYTVQLTIIVHETPPPADTRVSGTPTGGSGGGGRSMGGGMMGPGGPMSGGMMGPAGPMSGGGMMGPAGPMGGGPGGPGRPAARPPMGGGGGMGAAQ